MSIISVFLRRWHIHTRTRMQPLLQGAALPWWLRRGVPGSRSQSWFTEAGACHSPAGCRIEKNLNRLDLTLSFSSCRLYTSLYLSSHHTSAWEWLAFPQGHLIWSPCFICTNTHTFITLQLYFPPRLAVLSVLMIRRRQKVLQVGLYDPDLEQCKSQPAAEVRTEQLGNEDTQPGSAAVHPYAELLSALCTLLNRDTAAWTGSPYLTQLSSSLQPASACTS